MGIITNPKFLPTVMIVLDLAASAVYFAAGDIRRGVYWAAAAVLTTSMTY
jgi:hypothetical protein